MTKTVSKEALARAHLRVESLGFQLAPPDHPIYQEGPSIFFFSRVPKRLGQPRAAVLTDADPASNDPDKQQ